MSPVLRWATIAFNLAVVAWIGLGVREALDSCDDFDLWRLDVCRAGGGLGSGVSMGMIVFIWVAGNVVLRVPELFERRPAYTPSRARSGEAVGTGHLVGPDARAEAADPLGYDVEHLRRLAGLRDDGILDEEEFVAQKTRMLAGEPHLGPVDVEHLRRVAALRDDRLLEEDEFVVQKTRMLDGRPHLTEVDVESLRRLRSLLDDNVLTEEEFAEGKAKLLGPSDSGGRTSLLARVVPRRPRPPSSNEPS